MDSNIDWGQDLKGVRSWMEEHDVEKVTLGYWGPDDPEFRKIQHDNLKCYQTSGVLLVSVNVVNGTRDAPCGAREFAG